MIETYKHRHIVYIGLVVLLAFSLSLNSCAPKTQSPSPIPSTLLPTEVPATNTPIPTETTTATPTLLPVETKTSSGFGLIVFSMGDGLYSHLFVFDPYSLPMTRLTAGNWDDADPAVSPDGRQVAFTSNRDGQWDIYVQDLSTDKLTRITNTQTYDGSPAWSPDGQYIVFQTKNGSRTDLVVQSITDLTSAPIQITEKAGMNIDPAWSPDGQKIVFVTNRNGNNEIWLFDLKSPDNRFTVIATSNQADYFNPAWSPDGSTLAWCKKDNEDHIETISITDLTATPNEIGIGCMPVWSPDGRSILATFQQPNSQYIVAYNVKDKTMSLPMINTSAKVSSLTWIDANTAKYLLNFVNLQQLPTPAPLFTTILSLPSSDSGRSGVVEIGNLSAPNPYLADSCDESFKALRQVFAKKVGWDFLASLDNAYLPLTATTYPGIIENWLFTGRAIALNTGALPAGWMTVTREDFDGKTYWRVWIKCLNQAGGCGTPIPTHTWDFSSRNSGNLQAYEDGGKLSGIPDGYWVDFTEFASRYGWERLPAQNDWRYYFPGTLFNQFAFRQGLTWRQAMLQLYPAEAINLLGAEK